MNRITQLDALRGFALLGIILGNVLWFSGVAVRQDTSALDSAVIFALHVFVDGKFYALFSLVFGASFSLMVSREQQRGRSGKVLAARRLVSLLVLGLAHATLLWFGDILSLYALAAVPLYALLGRCDRALGWWALGLLAAPLGTAAALLLLPDAVNASVLGYGPAGQLPAFGSGSYGELLSANAAFLVQRWVLALASGRLPRLLGMFALGVFLLRRRPSPTPRTRNALWLVAALSNIAYALLADVAAAPSSFLGLLREAVTCVAVPTGCLAYVSVLWPAVSKPGRVSGALAAAGRLSLTHYLSQSLALALIFYGCGLGLWGRLGAASAVMVGGGLAMVQVACSSVWFRRFGLGPGEHALRMMDRAFARDDHHL